MKSGKSSMHTTENNSTTGHPDMAISPAPRRWGAGRPRPCPDGGRDRAVGGEAGRQAPAPTRPIVSALHRQAANADVARATAEALTASVRRYRAAGSSRPAEAAGVRHVDP